MSYTERWETPEPREGFAFRVVEATWDLDADPPVRTVRKIDLCRAYVSLNPEDSGPGRVSLVPLGPAEAQREE